MTDVWHLAGGQVDTDRPRLKHRPNAKFPWQIVRGNEHVRLTDTHMRALVTAFLDHEESKWHALGDATEGID